MLVGEGFCHTLSAPLVRMGGTESLSAVLAVCSTEPKSHISSMINPQWDMMEVVDSSSSVLVLANAQRI